jgi:hypothetical protein
MSVSLCFQLVQGKYNGYQALSRSRPAILGDIPRYDTQLVQRLVLLLVDDTELAALVHVKQTWMKICKLLRALCGNPRTAAVSTESYLIQVGCWQGRKRERRAAGGGHLLPRAPDRPPRAPDGLGPLPARPPLLDALRSTRLLHCMFQRVAGHAILVHSTWSCSVAGRRGAQLRGLQWCNLACTNADSSMLPGYCHWMLCGRQTSTARATLLAGRTHVWPTVPGRSLQAWPWLYWLHSSDI